MTRLRTISSRRLAAILAVVAVVAATAGIAQAALGGDPKPEPKALDRAIVDAVNAPPPAGVSARIRFTNHLVPSGALPGGGPSPLLAGAEGRLWASGDGRMRLELQSGRGDAQIAADGEQLSVYDAGSKTVYRIPMRAPAAKRGDHRPATLAGVRRGLERLAQTWSLSGAKPTSTGGRPSYTLRIAPKDDGGLLGAGELAWDAEKGVPLRIAVYAQGDSDPVLELEATDISFGSVSDADLRASVPAGTKSVEVEPPAGHARTAGRGPTDVTGVDAVQARLGFRLSAPRELAGLPRKQVRLVRLNGELGALTVYGEGLGGIAVLQHEAADDGDGPPTERGGEGLPQVNIDGATGTELATALGTMLSFEREGVSYTVLGSVPPVAAENAARGLR
jgi:outer membrane lipoprotein-sorting protein